MTLKATKCTVILHNPPGGFYIPTKGRKAWRMQLRLKLDYTGHISVARETMDRGWLEWVEVTTGKWDGQVVSLLHEIGGLDLVELNQLLTPIAAEVIEPEMPK